MIFSAERGTKMTTRSLCSRKSEQGFSLIEVLIAISILAIGLLAVASMQGSASKNNVLAGSRTEAATLASEQMETLLSLDWDDGLLDPGDHQLVRGRYTISWNVVDNAIIDSTKTITLSVTWSDYGGNGRLSMQRVIPRIS
jgi:type IV pilus assembly protein PilV